MTNLIVVFIVGLLIGSFLNVVIYRLDELKTILFTRSHCPHCITILKWYDLIPFLSFILLKTKCRYCKKQISWQYPLVEIATALLFSLIFWVFGNHIYSYLLLIATCFFTVIFVYDIKKYIIPDEMIWPLAVIILITNILLSLLVDKSIFPSGLLGALIGAGFLGLLFALGKGKWMGGGDIKLGLVIGLIVGYPLVIVSLFSAFVLGSIVGIILIIAKIKSFKDILPFGPFLIIGFYLAIFIGGNLINWYLGTWFLR